MKNKKWFASDTAFKIYSLLIAVLFWIFVIFDQNPESVKVIRNVPIYYNNLDSLERAGYTVFKEEDMFLDVTVKGKRLAIGRLSKNNIKASVTFSEFREGTYDINVDTSLPQSDMSVQKENPYSVSVKVEKLISKEFEIGILYSGTNEPGKLASAELKFKTVTVSGPETAMNNVKSAKISLDYTAVSASPSGTSNIRIYDENGNDITTDRNLRISSDKVNWESKIYNVKDVALNLAFSDDSYSAESLKISDSSVKLCLTGKAEFSADKVKTLPVSREDIKKIQAGESVDVRLNLPSGINVIKQNANGLWVVDETNTVSVSGTIMHIKKIPLSAGKNIEITNKKDGYKYTLKNIPDEVSLKYKNSVSEESLENIKFFVDAAELSSGEHVLLLAAELPSGVTLPEEYRLTLVIK